MSTSFDEFLTHVAQSDPAADLPVRASVEVDRLVDAIVEVPYVRSGGGGPLGPDPSCSLRRS
ncbi:MAG: hypothetical protein R2715_21470 [Ilumatobacteraceae bacterium]